jgi:thioredoxin-related protein
MPYFKNISTIIIGMLMTWCLCSVATAGSLSPKDTADQEQFFHSFSGSLTTELDQLKEQQLKGAVLFFSTQHCRFCRRMKAVVFTQKAVQTYYHKHFKIFEIDIESEKTLLDEQMQSISYVAYAKKHRVRLTPTIVFLDAAGEVSYRHVGIIANPQEFIWLGEYVVSGETRKHNFAHFKMEKRRHNTQP